MRPDTADKYATSHAGDHGDFAVVWCEQGELVERDRHGVFVPSVAAWYVAIGAKRLGPHATSQEAWSIVKDAIDKLVMEEMKD